MNLIRNVRKQSLLNQPNVPLLGDIQKLFCTSQELGLSDKDQIDLVVEKFHHAKPFQQPELDAHFEDNYKWFIHYLHIVY